MSTKRPRDQEEDLDSSNESEDYDDDNNYQYDGFVVDDNEEEDEVPFRAYMPDEPRQLPIKKHKKRLRQGDDEDLDLINDYYQPQIVQVPDSDQSAGGDEMSLYDDDYDSDSQTPYAHPHLQLAASIFGPGYQENQKLDEEVEDVDKKEMFDPTEKKEQFMTPEDEIVRNLDVPERLQTLLKNREHPQEEELMKETEWLVNKTELEDRDVNELLKKVLVFLQLYRVEKYEIPFIVKYRFHLLQPEIASERELWDFQRWDLEWGHMYQVKRSISQTLLQAQRNWFRLQENGVLDPDAKVLLNHDGQLPDSIEKLLEFHSHNSYRFEIADLYKYIDTFVYNYSSLQDTNRTYKPIHEARKNRIPEVAKKVGISPEQLMQNIENKEQIFKPDHAGHKPSEIAFEYICVSYPDEVKVLNGVSFLMATEIASQPVFRQFVREEFMKYARIHTIPTDKGKSVLDVQHPYYRVKQLNGKVLSSFHDIIWAEIAKCEKEGLIQVQFMFPWSDEDDRILENLKLLYLLREETSEDDYEWNLLRVNILKQSLVQTYRDIEQLVREELSIQAEYLIIKNCQARFRDIIERPPYRLPDEEDPRPKVLSLIISNEKNGGSFTAAVLDANGQLLDLAEFQKLLERRPENMQEVERNSFCEELKSFVNLILNNRPDVVVIGANNIESVHARRIIGNYIEALTHTGFTDNKFPFNVDRSLLYINKPGLVMEDMQVPQLFAYSNRCRRLLPELKNSQRLAISLARFFQNPLAETLSLWSDPNENLIPMLKLHPLQKEIPEKRLKQALENIAVDIVSDRGVVINQLVNNDHLAATLAFIPGLGLVKAHNLLKDIKHKTKGRLVMRAQLISKRLLTPKVFENCAGFICIHTGDANNTDPLDSTRIHPEQYGLAIFVAASALEITDENKMDEQLIFKVMKEPRYMEDLDIAQYAEIAERQGKGNIKDAAYFIVKELTQPFANRFKRYQEYSPMDLFYMCTGENPQTLRRGSLVQATIIGYEDKKELLNLRLECNVPAIVDKKNFTENPDPMKEEILAIYKKGSSVTGRVLEISGKMTSDKDLFFRVRLSLLQEDIRNHQKYLDAQLDETFVMDNNDLYEQNVVDDEHRHNQKYIPRIVGHPNFKNIGLKTALEELANKDIGEYVFRPSSKGTDHLTCTWKFYDFVYSHLDVIEEGKPASNMLGTRFKISGEIYESLQEIVDRYVRPCEKLTKEAIEHPKFKDSTNGGLKFIEQLLRQDKAMNGNTIPYYFTIVPMYPQFLVLSYLPKDRIKEEYIKVKPKGLYFHDAYHLNLPNLVAWFKRHYNDKNYNYHLSRLRPPDFDTSDFYANAGRMERPSTPHRMVEEFQTRPLHESSRKSPYAETPYVRTPRGSAQEWGSSLRSTPRADDPDAARHYERYKGTPKDRRRSDSAGWDEPRERHKKSRPPRDSGGRSCNKCGKEGHMARECPQQQARACYNCGEEGHIAKDCPKERNPRPVRKRNDRNTHEQETRSPWGGAISDTWGQQSQSANTWAPPEAQDPSGWGESQGWPMTPNQDTWQVEEEKKQQWPEPDTSWSNQNNDGW